MSCKRDDAVSELVGEMLMLTIVLILLAIFSATASNYLPPPRDPSVTIKTDWTPNETETGSIDITLYHKGGDWMKTSDLTVIISNSTVVWKYPHDSFRLRPDPLSQSFDFGDWITITSVPNATSGYEVSLVTPRAVISAGVVSP